MIWDDPVNTFIICLSGLQSRIQEELVNTSTTSRSGTWSRTQSGKIGRGLMRAQKGLINTFTTSRSGFWGGT